MYKLSVTQKKELLAPELMQKVKVDSVRKLCYMPRKINNNNNNNNNNNDNDSDSDSDSDSDNGNGNGNGNGDAPGPWYGLGPKDSTQALREDDNNNNNDNNTNKTLFKCQTM